MSKTNDYFCCEYCGASIWDKTAQLVIDTTKKQTIATVLDTYTCRTCKISYRVDANDGSICEVS